jgi:pilus assembly protein CpaF
VDRASSSDLSGLSLLTATLSGAFSEVANAIGDEVLAQEADAATASRIGTLLDEALKPLGDIELPAGVVIEQLKAQLSSELLDVGPLGPLLAEDAVSEISIGRFDRIMAVRDGQASLVVPAFSCERAFGLAIDRLCTRAGIPLEDGEEFVERRLKDGTRLSAVLGPVALGGTLCVLRKSHSSALTVEDLVRRGTVSRGMATFLQHALAARANILLVGSRDAGLEVTVNALSTACDDSTLLAMEDLDELVRDSPRTRRLDVSGLGEEIGQLLRLALRVGDSRLVVDLATGERAAAVLEAIIDGADGVLGSLRAPSLPSALTRLASSVASCRPGMNSDAAREWLASSFDLVLEVRRLRDGRYRVLRLCELVTPEQGLSTQDIFTFVVERTAAGGAIEGTFTASGVVPRFVEQLNARGYSVDTSVFTRPPSR